MNYFKTNKAEVALLVALGITIMLLAYVASAAVPDAGLTPGTTFKRPLKTICKTGYSDSVRKVSVATKKQVCLDYGVFKDCPGPAYEIDHLVPLSLGGDNQKTNLWPQPIAEALRKDVYERELRKKVCGGQAPIAQAQDFMRWWKP